MGVAYHIFPVTEAMFFAQLCLCILGLAVVRFGLHRLVSILRAALALLLMLPCLVYLFFSGCVLLILVARLDAHHSSLIAPRTLATEDLP